MKKILATCLIPLSFLASPLFAMQSDSLIGKSYTVENVDSDCPSGKVTFYKDHINLLEGCLKGAGSYIGTKESLDYYGLDNPSKIPVKYFGDSILVNVPGLVNSIGRLQRSNKGELIMISENNLSILKRATK